MLKTNIKSYDAGVQIGFALGAGIDLVEAGIYGIFAISALSGSPKALKFLAPLAVPNIISGLCEVYRDMYNRSRQKLMDDIE